jgi:hypothetical protein
MSDRIRNHGAFTGELIGLKYYLKSLAGKSSPGVQKLRINSKPDSCFKKSLVKIVLAFHYF